MTRNPETISQNGTPLTTFIVAQVYQNPPVARVPPPSAISSQGSLNTIRMRPSVRNLVPQPFLLPNLAFGSVSSLSLLPALDQMSAAATASSNPLSETPFSPFLWMRMGIDWPRSTSIQRPSRNEYSGEMRAFPISAAAVAVSVEPLANGASGGENIRKPSGARRDSSPAQRRNSSRKGSRERTSTVPANLASARSRSAADSVRSANSPSSDSPRRIDHLPSQRAVV